MTDRCNRLLARTVYGWQHPRGTRAALTAGLRAAPETQRHAALSGST